MNKELSEMTLEELWELFPIILNEHIPKIVDAMIVLNHSELIIHPVWKSEDITPNTIYKLSEKINIASRILKDNKMKLFV